MNLYKLLVIELNNFDINLYKCNSQRESAQQTF